MRKLKTHYIGRLVSFAGTVTRTSEVRPELFLATFKCMGCGTLKRNVPQQFRYTEPLMCDAPTCGNTYVTGDVYLVMCFSENDAHICRVSSFPHLDQHHRTQYLQYAHTPCTYAHTEHTYTHQTPHTTHHQHRSAWQLVKEDSTFVDWQKACVQEAPSEVPSGCLPRTLDVILRNDMVEKVRPGDKVVFTGDVIVVPDVSVFNTPGEKVVAKKGMMNGWVGISHM